MIVFEALRSDMFGEAQKIRSRKVPQNSGKPELYCIPLVDTHFLHRRQSFFIA
jgi:hypothetical protein